MGRIRILYITGAKEAASQTLGGGEIQLLSLISGLDKRAFDVFVSYPKEGHFSKLLVQKGIEGIRIDTRRFLGLFAVCSLCRFLKEKRIDIIHAYDLRSSFIGMLAGWLAQVPVRLFTNHLPHFPARLRLSKKEKLRRQLRLMRDHVAGRLCTKIIAVSDEIAGELVNRVHIPPAKVATIPNGVDNRKFDPTVLKSKGMLLKQFGINGEVPIIGMVARLEPQKGHLCLLKAASIVLKKIPQAKFFIVGNGWYQDYLKNLSGTLGIEKSIVFTGFRSDVRDIVGAFDIKVLPSLDEGCNLSVVEAMLLEKPVIVSDIPSLAAMVDNGVNGFVFPPESPETLAQLLFQLIQDKELACRLGLKGRQIAIERYGLDRMVAQTRNLYHGLTGRG